MRKYRLLVLSTCLLFPAISFADTSTDTSSATPAANTASTAPAANAAPAAPAPLPGHPPIPQHDILGFTVSGYLDGSYNYLSQSNMFTSGIPDRFYDTNENGFSLQQFELMIAKQPSQGLGGVVNGIIGRDANVSASYGLTPQWDSQNLAFSLQQAYLQYAIKSWTFLLGQYYTLAGYEASLVPQNANYSYSNLATFAEPISHMGIRATYAVNDKVNLVMGVNNGWDNIRDLSRRKTIELGAAYTDPKYTFSVYWYNGQERAAAAFPFTNVGPTGIRNLVDLVASMNVTDKLTLAANYDFVTQNRALLPSGLYGRANWQGIAGYLQYQFNDKWRVALRADYFNDRDGFSTGVPQSLTEGTLTIGYQVFKQLEFRAETRHDVSNTNSFLQKNLVNTANNLQSYALQAVLTI